MVINIKQKNLLILGIITILIATGIIFISDYIQSATELKECTTDTGCEPSFFCCGGWRCISNNEAYVKEHPYYDCMVACYRPPKEEAPIGCKCINNKCQSYDLTE